MIRFLIIASLEGILPPVSLSRLSCHERNLLVHLRRLEFAMPYYLEKVVTVRAGFAFASGGALLY